MKKILLLIPFILLSSCVIIDSGYYERDNLSFTTWEGIPGNPYSVAFGSYGDTATFTFIDSFGNRYAATASYMWETSFGGYPAALYKIHSSSPHGGQYYAFYRSGRVLYGNASGNLTSSFDYRYPEYVADLR